MVTCEVVRCFSRKRKERKERRETAEESCWLNLLTDITANLPDPTDKDACSHNLITLEDGIRKETQCNRLFLL